MSHLLYGGKPYLRAGWVGRHGRVRRKGEWFTGPGPKSAVGRVLVFCGLLPSLPTHLVPVTRDLRSVTCEACRVRADSLLEQSALTITNNRGRVLVILARDVTPAELAEIISRPFGEAKLQTPEAA